MYKKRLSLVAVTLLSQTLFAQISLEPILVTTAINSTQNIEDVTSNIEVITAEQMDERKYTTVIEALNSLSGVSFTSNGGLGSSSALFLRGMDSKRVLVLIDGIRYNDVTGLSGAPFEHLMADEIEKIELIKGAQSSVWGADASAGVINIITNSASKGLHGSIMSEFGSFNTKKYGASASFKDEIFFVKLSSHKIDSDGFSAKATKGVELKSFEDDGYKNTTTRLKLGFNINETNKIEISHNIIDARGEYDGTNTPSDTTHSTTKDQFTSINFNHIDSFNELDIYAKRSTFDREYVTPALYEYDGEVDEYGIKSKIDYDNSSFLALGADYKKLEHKNNINKNYTNKALFFTNSNRFNSDQTILTESLRVDKYSDFDNKTTYKIGIKHDFNDALYVSANYATAYNVPTIANLYGIWGANPALKPENTKSYDFSVGYEDFKATCFNTKVKDMIDWDGTKYNNLLGDSKIKGYELNYDTDLSKSLFLSMNYTWLKALDSSDHTLQRRPKETLKASLQYYANEKLNIGANAEYVGERIEYQYGTYNVSASTGGYTLINANINYDLQGSIQIYAKIDNITDKYYQATDGYASSPRAYYAGVKVSF